MQEIQQEIGRSCERIAKVFTKILSLARLPKYGVNWDIRGGGLPYRISSMSSSFYLCSTY